MYKKQIKQINNSLRHTKKAIIALGCSFVQGQGAIDDYFYEDYKWEYTIGIPLDIKASTEQKLQILKKHPELSIHNGKIDFTFMEYENAFVNVLCKKYLNGAYTPMNFGLRGCGNRASIKDLYFQTEIEWNLAEEIIVLYVPSGVERFDFLNDTWTDHFHFKAMWPNQHENPHRNQLWEGYKKTLWSEKFGVLEQISNVLELQNWCKLKNAKLFITPGFDTRYTRKHFLHELNTVVVRNGHELIESQRSNIIFNQDEASLVDLFPWECMITPGGYNTFLELALSHEPTIPPEDFFFRCAGVGSPNKWITPCSHPSAKAHDLFAKHLSESILK